MSSLGQGFQGILYECVCPVVVLVSLDIIVWLSPVEALGCVAESPPDGSGILLIIPQEATQLVPLNIEKPGSAATTRKCQPLLCPLVALGPGQDIRIVDFLLYNVVVSLVGLQMQNQLSYCYCLAGKSSDTLGVILYFSLQFFKAKIC